jgi:DNA polymerase-3 subunit alpha
MSGAFDCFEGIHRRQYIANDDGEASLIEKAIKYANKMQLDAESAQSSLFGGESGLAIPAPKIMPVEPYGKIEMLNIEKEVVGLYISGHPLDQYKFEIKHLCNTSVKQLKDLDGLKSKGRITVGGVVTAVSHRITKTGKPYGVMTLEDYDDSMEFFMFSDKYVNFKQYLETGWFLYLKGTVKARWKRENEFEFSIDDMELLGEVREKMTKGIVLRMHLQDLSSAFVNELTNLTDENPGNCLLRLNILSDFDGEPIQVELLSRKARINPTNELMERIAGMEQLSYRVIN